MKIKIKSRYGMVEEELSISALVERTCDGSGYETGELESLCSSLRRQNELLARIVEKLNLSNEELTKWFGEWSKTIEKIEE